VGLVACVEPSGAPNNIPLPAFVVVSSLPEDMPFVRVFMVLPGREEARKFSFRWTGTIAGVRHFVLWDELQDPLSSFVPDLSPASAGFFFGSDTFDQNLPPGMKQRIRTSPRS
jgi:hypothetical protein